MTTVGHVDELGTTNIGTRVVIPARRPGAAEAAPTPLPQWRIDPAASGVTFSIGKRLLFVKRLTVVGRFADVQGTLSMDERDPANARAEVTIGAASIDTQQARRDAHLRSAAFFDVARYPTLCFAGRRIEAIDTASGRYRVTGDLTIRDITREVCLEARYSPAVTRAGSSRITVALTASLNRHDFGLSWSNPLIRIADDLTVAIEVQAVGQS